MIGCKAPKNKENWVRCFVCHGHSLDVLDLDWSPTHFLASASVDNTIMIWNIPLNDNAAVNLSPIHILREHNSFVRGVSFDPIGQYLVSCAADNSVIVWNCESQFSVAAELPEVLKDSPDSTLFRRISWSPDGQCVCLSAATRSDKPVGVILKRGSWESLGDLVGHNGSVAGN